MDNDINGSHTKKSVWIRSTAVCTCVSLCQRRHSRHVFNCVSAFAFWSGNKRSNIFAPPDGGLTCLICESNTAVSLAEPTSNPLTPICDDTWWYNRNRSSGKQKADKTNTFQNWSCVDKRVSSSLVMWLQEAGFCKGSLWHGVCAGRRHLARFRWHHWSLWRFFRQPIKAGFKNALNNAVCP